MMTGLTQPGPSETNWFFARKAEEGYRVTFRVIRIEEGWWSKPNMYLKPSISRQKYLQSVASVYTKDMYIMLLDQKNINIVKC